MNTSAESFSYEMARAENKCFQEITNIFQEAYKSQRESIRKYIFETIERYFPGFQKFDTANYIKLLNIVDASLEAFANRQEGIAATLFNKVSTHTLGVGNLAMRQPIERASSALSVYTHELINDNSINKIDVEKDELRISVCRFLDHNKTVLRDLSKAVRQGEPWDSVSMRVELDIDEFLNKTVTEIKNVCKNRMGELLEGYVSTIIPIIDNYLTSLNFNRTDRKNKDEQLAKAGYKISFDKTGLILTSNEDEKSLIDKNEQGELTANDGKTIIRENNTVQVINGKASIIIDDDAICMGIAGDSEKEREIRVEVIDDNFDFYYKDQKITDLVAKSGIIEAIKMQWPSVYKEFEKSINFKNIVEMAKNAEKKANKFYIDAAGNVRLNEEHKQELTDSVSILGYQVIDGEDGVRFAKNGVASKVKYRNDFITLDDVPEVIIQTDFYIYGKQGVMGPLVNYTNKKENVRFFASKDLLTMNLFFDDFGFFVKSDGTNVKYMVRKGNHEINDENAKEMVEEAFSQFMPEAYENFKQKHGIEDNKITSLTQLNIVEEQGYTPNSQLIQELDETNDFNPLINNEFISPEDMVSKNVEELMEELSSDEELSEERPSLQAIL